MQMVFEEFGFRSFLAMPAQPLSLLQWQAESQGIPANAAGIGCVLDAGENPATPHSQYVDTSLQYRAVFFNSLPKRPPTEAL